MISAQQPAPFQSASLYVGDLHHDVTEGLLFELFNRVGPVASIRVCRDAMTRRSLGYAYVNFHNVQDAERALDTMNFNDIKGNPCRIMWSQRDPSLRKSGLGNVFAKNLAPTVDNKGLFDTFSVFGNILSCKVATDANGKSKGYGYIHYETAEAAQDAISKFNGSFMDDMQVFVGPFVRRQDRGQGSWTNLYVKQFPVAWGDSQLKDLFAPYGNIVSAVVAKDPDGKGKGFGFVNFSEHEAAEKALNELNGKIITDPSVEGELTLYVNRAQKKEVRVREIKTQLDAMKEERVSKYQGMNLYVKNLDDSITDEIFREHFAKFGTITSARIMRDPIDNSSKGFGFVCYSSPDEATRAVTELNGMILRSKPIMVTLHQRKDLRRAHLAATYAPRNMRFPAGPAGMPLPYMPMYVPQPGQQGFPPQQRPFPYQQQHPQQYPPRGTPRGMGFNGGGRGGGPGGYFVQQGYPQQLQQQQQGVQGAAQQLPPFKRVMAPGVAGQQQQQQQQGMQTQLGVGPTGPALGRRITPGPQQPQGRGVPIGGRGYMGAGIPPQQQMGLAGRPGIKFNNNVRNQQGAVQPNMIVQMMPQQQQQQLPMSMSGSMSDPLDDQALAQAEPQTQKNMIGEKLYPLIYQHQPLQAGKITGMLLEMDNAELLNLIESPDALLNKIEEALLVLKNHNPSSEE